MMIVCEIVPLLMLSSTISLDSLIVLSANANRSTFNSLATDRASRISGACSYIPCNDDDDDDDDDSSSGDNMMMVVVVVVVVMMMMMVVVMIVILIVMIVCTYQ